MLDRTNTGPLLRPALTMPENTEAEQALLGALLMNGKAISALPPGFEAAHFYHAVHAEIFDAIRRGAETGTTISPITIKSLLSPQTAQMTMGDLNMSAYLARLCAEAVTILNVPDYADAIMSSARRREAIQAAQLVEMAASSARDDAQFYADIQATRDQLDKLLKSSTSKIKPLTFLSWKEIKAKAPKLEWLVEDMLTIGDRSLIVGSPGSGKSFLGLELAMSICRGVDFLGRKVLQGSVLYQAKEGSSGFSSRIEAYRVHNDLPEDTELPFYYLPEKIDLFAADGDTQALINEINNLKAIVPNIRILFIDTFNRAAGNANEIDGAHMRQIISHIERIQTECGIHVCVIHHLSAAGRTRGHTSLEGDFDQRFIISRDPDSNMRTLQIAKQKEGEDGVKIQFALSQVKLGFDEERQKDITSCVVVTVPEKQRLERELAKKGYSPNKAERTFLLNFFEAERIYGQYCIGQDDLPRAAYQKTVINFSDYLDVAIANDPRITESSSPEEIKKARNTLSKWFVNNPSLRQYGVLGYERPYLWWTGKPVRGFAHTFPEQNPDSEQNQAAYVAGNDDLDVGF